MIVLMPHYKNAKIIWRVLNERIGRVTQRACVLESRNLFVTNTFAYDGDRQNLEPLKMNTKKLASNNIKFHFALCGIQIYLMGIKTEKKPQGNHNSNTGSHS